MKKFVILFALLCFSSFSFASTSEENLGCSRVYKKNSEDYSSGKNYKYSQESKDKDEKGDQIKDEIGLSFAFKAAYFWPQSKVYRDVYGNGGFIPLVEACYKIKDGWGAWLECGYFYKSHHVTSADLRVKAEVTQVPLSLGINYTFSVASNWDIYAKLGPNWIYTKTWVDIPNIQKTVIKNVFGATLGVGGKYNFHENWFAEIFLNYLIDRKKIEMPDETVRRWLGGIQTGVGIGYHF